MNKLITLVLGALFMIALSTMFLVIVPYAQLKSVPPTPGLKPYTDVELRGRYIYMREGCVYCHSQQPRDPRQAPDGKRGWGRPSVPGDYYYDTPHLLGTMRTGPDLLNIGARQPSVDWHLSHLYQPRAVIPGSIMPAYPYLFRIQKAARPTDKLVTLPPEFAPAEGKVVASEDALDLVAYLLALDRTFPAISGPEGKKEGAGS